MNILIQADGETEPREVADLEEAQALADEGHVVLVPNKDGGHRQLAASDGTMLTIAPGPVAVVVKKPAAKKAPARKTARK